MSEHPREVVVTHDVADFDAVASAVAAARLYPGAAIVRRRLFSTEVRPFLALHKHRFEVVSHRDLDENAVRRLVVVDVRRKSRLGDFPRLLERIEGGDPELEVHVWDHHGPAPDDIPAARAVVEPVGAAVTLLLERIREQEIPIDPMEATLFALGIHADTGSLTYPTTTARDAAALAWLLGQGACLGMIERYLRPELGPAQRTLLARLLENVELERIGGVDVGFAVVPLRRAIGSMAQVTTHACRLGPAAALFALYPIGERRVQVIARAAKPFVDLGEVLATIGGGGHGDAASAIVKGVSVETVRETLVAALVAHPPRPRLVRELMSSPVRTADVETPIVEVADLLEAGHHSGLPVLRDGGLVGVFSRTDLQRASDDEATEAPVRRYMTSPVDTIGPDAVLEDALATMSARGVGRLPVLEGDRIVGIVSRSDVLRALYPLRAAATTGAAEAGGAG